MADPTLDILTFDAFIRHWAKEQPDRIALSQDGRSQCYAQLAENTAKIAWILRDLGLKKGDRIAWIGKNSDLYFSLFYGAARVGIVMVPIGWRLAPAEWCYIVNDTAAKIVFTGAEFDVAAVLAGQTPHVEKIIREADARVMIAAASHVDFDAAGPDDPVLQLYTSGTTGNPKGAVLSNRNLFALRKHAEGSDQAYTKWDDNEVVLVAMPCAHIGGTGLGIMAMASGLPALILAEFTPDGVFDAIETAGVTRLFVVPAALHIMLQCIKVFNAEFIQVYGMTETTGSIVMLPPEDHDPNGNARMRSAGKALPGVEIRIVNGAGDDVAVGEVGEIWTRSSNNMLGYWNLPQATESTMASGGWIKTGDAGYLDEDGYLFIHDRVKDMIISGGENVYPAEVESAIFGHPDVLEVAVIGVPDDKWGESVKAVCVPRAGAALEADSVIQWARERIAAFKVPKSVDVISALPRNASGKILRKDLRAPYWEGRERQVN